MGPALGIAAGGAACTAVGARAATAGARPCGFWDEKVKHIQDPNFKHTKMLDDVGVQLLFQSVQFNRCAIWARRLESFRAETHAFLACASHPDLGEALFMAHFMDGHEGENNHIRLGLVYGEHRVRSMAGFMCIVKENSKIFQVVPDRRTIMEHYSSEEDCTMGTQPSWMQMRTGLTLNELRDQANNNPVSRKKYDFVGNNCQDFAKEMCQSCTGEIIAGRVRFRVPSGLAPNACVGSESQSSSDPVRPVKLGDSEVVQEVDSR